MTLQIYIDDSGSDPGSEQFVLAGYVADGEAWKRFADEWRRVLEREPRLEYFKMVEAAGMRGQFRPELGWTREMVNARLVSLTDLIKGHSFLQVSTHILAADYNSTLRIIPHIAGSGNIVHKSPYNIMVHRLITEFFSGALKKDSRTPAIGYLTCRVGIWTSHFRRGKAPGALLKRECPN